MTTDVDAQLDNAAVGALGYAVYDTQYIPGGHTYTATVQASPTPTSTVFTVELGMGAAFRAGVDLTVNTDTGTIDSIDGDEITLLVALSGGAPSAGDTVTQVFTGSPRAFVPRRRSLALETDSVVFAPDQVIKSAIANSRYGETYVKNLKFKGGGQIGFPLNGESDTELFVAHYGDSKLLTAVTDSVKTTTTPITTDNGISVIQLTTGTGFQVGSGVVIGPNLVISAVEASPAPSTTVFDVAAGDGLLFTVGRAVAVGAQSSVISVIDVDEITVDPAFALAPTAADAVVQEIPGTVEPRQIVKFDSTAKTITVAELAFDHASGEAVVQEAQVQIAYSLLDTSVRQKLRQLIYESNKSGNWAFTFPQTFVDKMNVKFGKELVDITCDLACAGDPKFANAATTETALTTTLTDWDPSDDEEAAMTNPYSVVDLLMVAGGDPGATGESTTTIAVGADMLELDSDNGMLPKAFFDRKKNYKWFPGLAKVGVKWNVANSSLRPAEWSDYLVKGKATDLFMQAAQDVSATVESDFHWVCWHLPNIRLTKAPSQVKVDDLEMTAIEGRAIVRKGVTDDAILMYVKRSAPFAP